MKRFSTRFLAILAIPLLSLMPAGPASSRILPLHRTAADASPNLLYVAGQHLWLRSVDGGTPRAIPTPWPVQKPQYSAYDSSQGFQWSPDARRIALDDAGTRLAVINLANGHTTVLFARKCAKNCPVQVYVWSPNGRYLAIVRPHGQSDQADLVVWDDVTGTRRMLLSNVASNVAYPEWSHDSTRIAIEEGHFNFMNGSPNAVVLDLAGHATALGKGEFLKWSPDDRLLSVIRPNFCGANTCDEDELVIGANGQGRVLLARHSSSLFDSPYWAPKPSGYALDRWLLNTSGHITRRVAGPRERILTWRPDGARVALQTYYPYQGTPDVLYLSTPSGQRRHIYTDTRSSGCGACSKDVYSISWSHSGSLFAYATRSYPTPKDVIVLPKFFVQPVDGGTGTRLPIPGKGNFTILGFVNGDRDLIIFANLKVYRYTIASHALAVIATGVINSPGTPVLDPTVVGPAPHP